MSYTSQPACDRILVADDDAHIRRLIERSLARHGWEVTAAADGREAIAAWPAGGRGFDLVILDGNMPGADGLQAYRALSARHRDARFLFVSGDLHAAGLRRLVDEGRVPFLPKPFTPQSLVEAVRAALALDLAEEGALRAVEVGGALPRYA